MATTKTMSARGAPAPQPDMQPAPEPTPPATPVPSPMQCNAPYEFSKVGARGCTSTSAPVDQPGKYPSSTACRAGCGDGCLGFQYHKKTKICSNFAASIDGIDSSTSSRFRCFVKEFVCDSSEVYDGCNCVSSGPTPAPTPMPTSVPTPASGCSRNFIQTQGCCRSDGDVNAYEFPIAAALLDQTCAQVCKDDCMCIGYELKPHINKCELFFEMDSDPITHVSKSSKSCRKSQCGYVQYN